MNKWTALTWIAIAELFALSLWFSASVVVPALREAWQMAPGTEAWVSASVPIGFVAGAMISSYFGLPDRFNTRKMFALSALTGAILNGLLVLIDTAQLGILLRLLTGVTLAGVYPTAVKLLSQWFPTRRGLAIGILVAALTLGSSLPHFVVVFFSSVNWQLVILVSSISALLASVIMTWLLDDAPVPASRASFSFSLIKKVVRNRPVMLANYGYFGHMWELYAMWTWLPTFLTASFSIANHSLSPSLAAFASFLAIGVAGAIGAVGGGFFADKIGRARLTIVAMTVSAASAISIGFTYGQSIWLTLVLAIIWGISVIADSAQFSAAVSEFAENEYVGTALTFQMSVGFLITIFSINAVPLVEEWVGWEWVFTMLGIGPIFGIAAMVRFGKYESSR